jgi:hypothetical protein
VAAEPLDPASWIPLSSLALEGFGHAHTIEIRINNLRHELADRVILDDLGRACISRSCARVLFEERAAKQAEQRSRDELRRAEIAARNAVPEMRARIRALQQRESTGDPLADMKGAELEDSWERAARTRAEIASGGLVYHSISWREER